MPEVCDDQTKYSSEITDPESKAVVDEMLEMIMIELGYPVVKVELSREVLETILKLAIKHISKYSLFLMWCELDLTNSTASQHSGNYSRVYDLSKLPYKVSYIVDVIKSRGYNDVMYYGGDFQGMPFGWSSHQPSGFDPTQLVSQVSQLYNERILTSRLVSSYKDNMSYDFDRTKNLLYIDVGYPSTSKVTIEFVPVLTLNDLKLLRNNQDAYDAVLKYASAQTKISLGRARGKFTTSNYDWSISSAELIESGKSEMNEVNNYLNTNYSHIIID